MIYFGNEDTLEFFKGVGRSFQTLVAMNEILIVCLHQFVHSAYKDSV